MKLGINPMEGVIQAFGEAMADWVEQQAGAAEAEKVREEFAKAMSGEKTAVQIVIDLLSVIIFYAIGGLIGGAIGAAIFKKAPPAAPAPVAG